MRYYEDIAKRARKEILNMIYRTKSPHIGSSFSIIEILVALYFKILSISPDNPEAENRDRFILSKGHGCPALYAILSLRGFINQNILNKFAVNGGALGHHPIRDTKQGIEISTGSLGHGLSIGAGMAIAAKYDKSSYKIFVLLSDGEMNEGDVWETIMFASHHKLDNLVSVIDYNKIQALGRTNEVINLNPFAQKWNAFGWEVREIDGHNFEEIINTFENIPYGKGKPIVIIAHTLKGKGISFMENKLLWHYRCPSKEEYVKALQELS
jgi:transketolase